MTEFYTRNGDDGYTGLLGEGRVEKHHRRPEAVGTIDEATAAIGLARAHTKSGSTREMLLVVQRDLYHLMAEVSATPENAARFRKIDNQRIEWLENQVDQIGKAVEMPREFILPGDSIAGAAFALARTVVRRAERRVAELYHKKEIENQALLQYLNRLSSLCFLLELNENQIAGTKYTLAKDENPS